MTDIHNDPTTTGEVWSPTTDQTGSERDAGPVPGAMIPDSDPVPDPRMTDPQGRPLIPAMSDRELLAEIVANMRATVDAITALEQLPIVKAMQNGENPLMAMMRNR